MSEVKRQDVLLSVELENVTLEDDEELEKWVTAAIEELGLAEWVSVIIERVAEPGGLHA